jgi:uracil-DNA glycosylase
MDNRAARAAAYFEQQADLGLPPYVVSEQFALSAAFQSITNPPIKKIARAAMAAPAYAAPQQRKTTPLAAPVAASSPKKSAMPLSASRLMESATVKDQPTSSSSPTRERLGDFFHSVKDCVNCGLCKSRTKFVFGSGNADAKILIIGEAPGEQEDAQGLPFAGAAGDKLNQMLSGIGLDRTKDVFLTNVVKCRPPGTRDPDPAEIAACASILIGQLDIIAPKIVLLLGLVAAHALLKETGTISALRAAAHEYRGIPAFVTYHPAALLHNDSFRRPAWEDLKKFQQTLTLLLARG